MLAASATAHGDSDGEEERDQRLGLADRHGPHDRQGEPGTDQQDRLADTEPLEGEDRRPDDDRLPDDRGHVVRQQRQRPEGDGQERRVAIEGRVVDPGRLDVERQAGVEPGTRVVVRPDVGERVRRQMQDRRLDAEDDPEHRGQAQDDPDGRAGVDRHVRRGGVHGH